MATVPIERALQAVAALPAWRPRREALTDDLQALGCAIPVPIAVAVPGDRAEALGMLYVLEGSRLGGAIIADRVPTDLPRRFLASRHLSGEWRALLTHIDSEAVSYGPSYTDAIVQGARLGFDAYYRAALAMLRRK